MSHQEDHQIDEAFAEYLRLIDAGEFVDEAVFLSRYPDIADQLQPLIASTHTIRAMAEGQIEVTPPPSAESLRTLVLDLPSGKDPVDEPIESFGDFELLEELGRGGMGIVFRARQKSMNRVVALKMIIGGRYSSEESVRRFQREANAAGKLTHRNIVRAYTAGEHDGRHFFAMELIEGQTLRQILRAMEKPMAAATIALHGKALAEAVQYAHDNQVLHRDLKPSNVIVDQRNVPRIADFGLAKTIGADALSFSSSDSVIGTPAYMSPEQAAPGRIPVGPASDVYSLGAILYELLTQEPPFKDESPLGTLLLVLNQDPVPPSDLNTSCHRGLEAICLCCLQKKPEDRYQSCQELADDLDRVLRGVPVQARELTQTQRLWYWLRGMPLLALATGRDPSFATRAQRLTQYALAVGLCLAAVLFLFRSDIAESASLRHVDIGVAEAAGEYERIGGLLADTFSHPRVSVINTAGSVDSRDRLLSGELDLCILQDNTVSFSDISIVAPLYQEAILIVVRADSGLQQARELSDRAIALGRPNSGFRATSDQILSDLGIVTLQKFRDYAWTDLLSTPELDGAIITVGTRDARLAELLGSGEFRIVPMQIDDLPDRFRPYRFSPLELPAGAGIDESGVPAATAEAVLAVRTQTPDWFVQDCLEQLYSDRNSLSHSILTPAEAAVWSEGKSLHPAAREYYKQLASPAASR